MSCVIVDCGSGNLFSVAQALAFTAPLGKNEQDIVITHDPAMLSQAERIILPGQGAFARCYRGLAAQNGLLDMLERKVRVEKTPFLGICVGMQLMVELGLEHGAHAGLGWLRGRCEAIALPSDSGLKIPHMGWNDLDITKRGQTHPLLQGVVPGDHAYFVHSYAVTSCAEDAVLATSSYGGAVTAIIGQGNMFGTQFHVEKSQKLGLQILRNFWLWDGAWV
ncbi:MAG: imidazole glycerol phosphate synthase subunit HisH [Alphaproteobacteria bacterium]|nr:imidazole glycerol phosphate synthase subunit HisH [Alphaproteobacteria bacterium]